MCREPSWRDEIFSCRVAGTPATRQPLVQSPEDFRILSEKCGGKASQLCATAKLPLTGPVVYQGGGGPAEKGRFRRQFETLPENTPKHPAFGRSLASDRALTSQRSHVDRLVIGWGPAG